MTIRVTCECGKELLGPDECAGQEAVCPVCQRAMTLPNPESPIQPPRKPSMPPLEVGIVNAPAKEAPGISPVRCQSALESLILGLGSLIVPLLLGISAGIFEIYILGLFALFAPLLLGIPAAILGIRGLRTIDCDPQALRGKGMAITGLATGGLATVMTLAGVVLLPAVSRAPKAAARIHSVSRLKQIGLACHNFHDAFGCFPSEVPSNVPNRPNLFVPAGSKLSWRVQILPFIEQNDLYSEFHQDEPWDSPHNIKLLPRMPLLYHDPRFQSSGDREKGLTYYRGFVCPGGVFGSSPPVILTEITNKNGCSNTVMVVEAGEPVPWTKPEDPSFNENSPFGGPNRVKLFVAGFADGHVQTLPQNFDRKMIGRAINWQNTWPVQLP